MNKQELIELLQSMDGEEVLIDIPECAKYKDIVGVKQSGIYIHIETEHIYASLDIQ